MSLLLDNVTVDTAGAAMDVRDDDRTKGRDEITVQVAITGTATVQLYGRLGAALPWVLLATTSTPSLLPVARVAQMKADASNVGTNSSVTVATLAS